MLKGFGGELASGTSRKFQWKKNCCGIYSRVVVLAIAPLLERLKKVLALIDCCKYAALQHAINC